MIRRRRTAPNPSPSPNPKSEPQPQPNTDEDKGPLGNLTLQRVHATGHAVWLYLPANGVKLRCNELIHARLMPFKPDVTYFRGDLTRPIELVKVDVVRDEGPDQGKVTSVTNIRTIDGTMFDSGNGMDTANVIARGPGRTGNPARPRSAGRAQSPSGKTASKCRTSSDRTAKSNRRSSFCRGAGPVSLTHRKRPRSTRPAPSGFGSGPNRRWVRNQVRPPGHPAALPEQAHRPGRSIIMASSRATAPSPSSASTQTKAGDDRSADGDLGGGGFQIKRLVALRDVHLLAPSKTMTARERLDADFVDAQPTVVASAPTIKTESKPNSPGVNTDPTQAQEGQASAPGSGPSSSRSRLKSRNRRNQPNPP